MSKPDPAPRRKAPGKNNLKPVRAKTESPKSPAKPKASPCVIVGIGGSAGGFEAMQSLLNALSADTGIAFVFIQHLSSQQQSVAARLFTRNTQMPVKEIRHNMEIEPNTVYVIPPGKKVSLANRRLELSSTAASDHLTMPIDFFFHSLAKGEGLRAVGIILSGTGSDGTLGLGYIKSAGGITFAQAEKSAKYYGMPGNAVAAGVVDASLTPEAMTKQLAELAQDRNFTGGITQTDSEAEPAAPANGLQKVFQVLRHHSGVDFSLYKRSTMQRRIARRMVLQRTASPEAYAKLLKSNDAESDALFNDLLIHVTSFFRDKQVFTTLSRKIFPKIIKARRGPETEIRIWVPGCATGEEVYSLAITMVECMRKLGSTSRLQIFGTDLSELAIAKARTGIYSASSLQGISPERIRKYFSMINDQFQINRSVRDLCTFARQNVPQDPPFSRLDMISCRNVLIYLGPELQRRCMPIFHYSLNPDGYLLLGTAETVGTFSDLFTMVDKRCKIFQKKLTQVRLDVEFGTTAPVRPGLPRFQVQSGREVDIQAEIRREADRIVMTRVAPSGVVINSNLQVMQFRGATGRYLEHASGEASLNLLQMVKPALTMDLRAAIHKALKQDSAITCDDILMPLNGQDLLVSAEIIPFRVSPGGERTLAARAVPEPPGSRG